jgi:molybdenum cofactor biosynthesis enzyme MoaA
MSDLTKGWRTNEEQAVVDRLNAEIAQLREHNTNQIVLLEDNQREIERLSEICKTQHAEIERLNAMVLDLTDRLHWQVNENTSQRKLITELADALQSHYPFQWAERCPEHREAKLIHQAREATKDE